MELAGQPWVRSQTLEGMERRARGLPKAVFVRALEGRLAVVADSQPLVGPVQAVVGFMADQDHAGAAAQVPVIGDID